MKQERRGYARLALALLVGAVVTFAGAWSVVTSGVSGALEKSAKLAAADWATYLARTLPDIDDLLAGEPTNAEQREFLQRSEQIGKIFRFKLFDPQGLLRLDSHALHADATAGANLAAHNAMAAEVLRTGRSHLAAEEGDGVSYPRFYAEAYYPLVVDGTPVGTIEVYVDQTTSTRELYADFFNTVALTALLSAAGFLLPMSAFLWRSRQQFETQKKLAFAANHDGLTGLLNRVAFKQRVDDRIAAAANGKKPFHILFLDLDKFKDVNDMKGHAVGDDLLREVGERLRALTGPEDLFCRLGGDEFAICTPAADEADGAGALARQLIEAMQKPFRFKADEVNIGASVGIAAFPANGQTSGELLKAADLALYQAKRQGGGCWRVYQPAMEIERARRLAIEERLRAAVDRHEFQLAYQPLYDTDNGVLMGFEALLRLRERDGTPISPMEFIAVAEETGLIVPLGTAVLEDACRTATSWPEDVSVSVNLSPVQFETGSLVGVVRQALSSSGLAPQRLELEVTESILMRNPDAVALQLDQLKEFGVSIALDDFGTGYSSLSYLWKFPFDKLKIDRSFIHNLNGDDERSHQVLKTVVALGEVLRLSITAEGVETAAQAEEVKRMKIHQVQGFLYGAPMAAEAIDPAMFRAGPRERLLSG